MSAEAPILEEPPPPHTRARRRWFLRVLALLAILAVVVLGGVAWLLKTEGGARFVLGRVARMAGEGVRIEGATGSLGGVMRIPLIEVNRPGLYARIEDFEIATPIVDEVTVLQRAGGASHAGAAHAQHVSKKFLGDLKPV